MQKFKKQNKNSLSGLSRRKGKTKQKSIHELAGDATVYSYAIAQPRASPAVHTEQMISIEQSVIVTSAISTTVTPVFFAQAFQLADIDQYVALAAVFDQYKFNSVEVYIEPQTALTSIANPGKYVSIIDYDDTAALTTVGQALDYSNALVTGGVSSHYRRFVPHMAVGAYSGALFTGFRNVPADWCDCSSPTIKHYGLKLAFEPTSSITTFDLIFRYHISFKCVR